VADLCKLLSPENTIIFDYTSDLQQIHRSSDFTQWGVIGTFPWFFGIFHAYEWENDLRGNYDRIKERLPLAAADPMCKGFVYWPENSHSDSLILEFFTKNAWQPDTLTPEELLPAFCRDRYQGAAEQMLAAWQASLPLIKLHQELPLEFRNLATFAGREVTAKRVADIRAKLAKLEPQVKAFPELCEKLAALPYGTGAAFVDRDAIDLARTVAGRLFSVALYRYAATQGDWLAGRADTGAVKAAGARCTALLTALRDLLALHEDYAMNASMDKLRTVHPVNPCFEQALKGNAGERILPELYLRVVQRLLPQANGALRGVGGRARVAGGDKTSPMKPAKPLPMQAVADAFYAKPLREMAPPACADRGAAFRAAVDKLAAAVR
jgi:hypothetical protein